MFYLVTHLYSHLLTEQETVGTVVLTQQNPKQNPNLQTPMKIRHLDYVDSFISPSHCDYVSGIVCTCPLEMWTPLDRHLVLKGASIVGAPL